MPPVATSRSGRRPTLSARTMATTVKSMLTRPTTVDWPMADIRAKPASSKIRGA